MRGLLALLLLAAAGSAGLSAPWLQAWWLLAFIPVLLASGRLPGSSRYRVPATTGQGGYFIHGATCTCDRDTCSCEELVGWIGEPA